MIVTRLLAGAFGAGVHFRNQLYDRRTLAIAELQGPVVSVGNISVGGSGKTPFVIALGELLKQRGIAFDILSRGYGRETQGVRVVDPSGTPEDFGDEPLLMARRSGVQVVVGESRYAAGVEAEKQWGPRLHLLDDGFQHRRLARQFDIVLVTPEDFRDALLPAGRLREPIYTLQRADAIVLSGDPPVRLDYLPKKHVWRVSRKLQISKAPQRPVAFCAIGRPQNFFAQLRENGVSPAAEVVLRDHHRYTLRDIQKVLRKADWKHADGFITTEKDAINLGDLAGQLKPLTIARLETAIENGDAVLDTLLSTLRQRGKPAA